MLIPLFGGAVPLTALLLQDNSLTNVFESTISIVRGGGTQQIF
ncbi:hypothetical protein MSUIS_01690 [Mycoplasma suis KI3806]|uniref:Uncharacterized protein n=1 Tax=Mycoplasma suis (strain KI_3806) TaxID=708248 RepID=F0V340_MYCS3|nr:hypothetical protein MSUIS_01690 [Mycoplasma suis KI3806]